MLIIAINGSPNAEGNTAFLLREALNEIKSEGVETKFFQISEAVAQARHPFCTCCTTPCSGACYKGTLLEQMYNDLRRADGIILGSPVYFGTVSGQMKAFWDKTRALRKDKALVDVVGGAVTTGGSRYGGQESAARALHEIMLTHGMTVVGDGFYHDDAGHQAACSQRPSAEDLEAIKRTRILAKRVLEMAEVTAEMRKRNRGG
ncbi:multimeric flavodoxin WrbA [Desulfohalotomaculum tongense]|uniref:flavodoxin family protein n=1 Tax=Desulforadius tongensis TaxID=1216062 RepID=UPI0019577407|nr:flavodoxin family protein [Desulforadius tongensis]MBM7855774.1 multimeric flavodoxin WrbA [Desulforadius tongensis]